jgi:hypothetical protein
MGEAAFALGMRAEDADAALSDLLVHRRSLPVLTTQLADSLPAWAAGLRPESVIGPIRDRLGRDIWFDLFRRVRQVRFVRGAGGAPSSLCGSRSLPSRGFQQRSAYHLRPRSRQLLDRHAPHRRGSPPTSIPIYASRVAAFA